MIRCPHCQVENESAATVCQACGRAIAAAAAAELPQWLKQLKPDAPQAAPAIGTDTLVAARPTAAATTAPVSAQRATTAPARREATPMKGADKTAANGSSETAALISEDDLPSWLRAFSDNEAKDKGAAVEDTSWMVGNEADAATASTMANELAQSWQSRPAARPAAQHAPAVSVFTKPADAAAKPERVIAAVPKPAAPAAPSATGAPVVTLPPRPSTKAAPVAEKSSGMTLQRIAVIAFAVALIIFLVVVGIFIVAPALRGG